MPSSPPIASGGSLASLVFLGLETHHPMADSVHMGCSLCVSNSPLLIRTAVVGIRLTLLLCDHILTDDIDKDPLSK